MRTTLLVAACLIACAGSAARADLFLNVGDHSLLPNTPGQQIQIFVTGDPMQVDEKDLNAQVADGGPGVFGTVIGPALTGEILNGTPFAANNSGVQDLNPGFVFGNQFVVLQTATQAGQVQALGLFATLTIDTTGFSATSPGDLGPGHWSLNLGNTADGPSDFGFDKVSINITDGSIQITPEPSTFALGGLGLIGLIARSRRRR